MQRPPRSRAALAAALALALLATPACRRPRERAYTKEQERAVSAAVTATRPEVKRPLEVAFREGVRLIAADLDRDAVRPGESVDVTWTWEATADQEGGW